MLIGKVISWAIRGHILIEAEPYASILSKIYKILLPFNEKQREENKEQIREKAFEHSVDNEDLSEKTETSSNTTNAVSTSCYDKEIVHVTAE